ncbi:MAG TPA: hypothetical protein VGF92_09320 [Stellaceae bacterium]|jgi:hypothetical protein
MYRFAALSVLCLLLSGCVYYPYGYQPGYRYAPAYAYPAPAPAYPYAAPAQPYPPASGYPRTLGPNGDTAGATGS